MGVQKLNLLKYYRDILFWIKRQSAIEYLSQQTEEQFGIYISNENNKVKILSLFR